MVWNQNWMATWEGTNAVIAPFVGVALTISTLFVAWQVQRVAEANEVKSAKVLAIQLWVMFTHVLAHLKKARQTLETSAPEPERFDSAVVYIHKANSDRLLESLSRVTAFNVLVAQQVTAASMEIFRLQSHITFADEPLLMSRGEVSPGAAEALRKMLVEVERLTGEAVEAMRRVADIPQA